MVLHGKGLRVGRTITYWCSGNETWTDPYKPSNWFPFSGNPQTVHSSYPTGGFLPGIPGFIFHFSFPDPTRLGLREFRGQGLERAALEPPGHLTDGDLIRRRTPQANHRQLGIVSVLVCSSTFCRVLVTQNNCLTGNEYGNYQEVTEIFWGITLLLNLTGNKHGN